MENVFELRYWSDGTDSQLDLGRSLQHTDMPSSKPFFWSSGCISRICCSLRCYFFSMISVVFSCIYIYMNSDQIPDPIEEKHPHSILLRHLVWLVFWHTCRPNGSFFISPRQSIPAHDLISTDYSTWTLPAPPELPWVYWLFDWSMLSLPGQFKWKALSFKVIYDIIFMYLNNGLNRALWKISKAWDIKLNVIHVELIFKVKWLLV